MYNVFDHSLVTSFKGRSGEGSCGQGVGGFLGAHSRYHCLCKFQCKILKPTQHYSFPCLFASKNIHLFTYFFSISHCAVIYWKLKCSCVCRGSAYYIGLQEPMFPSVSGLGATDWSSTSCFSLGITIFSWSGWILGEN